MTPPQRFSAVSLSVSAFVTWVFIVTQITPQPSDGLLMTTFFGSFIVWLGSLLTFAGYKIRLARSNREIIYAHIMPSIRQGFLISATVATVLFIQFLGVVSTWDVVLVILVATCVEIAAQRPKSFSGTKHA